MRSPTEAPRAPGAVMADAAMSRERAASPRDHGTSSAGSASSAVGSVADRGRSFTAQSDNASASVNTPASPAPIARATELVAYGALQLAAGINHPDAPDDELLLLLGREVLLASEAYLARLKQVLARAART